MCFQSDNPRSELCFSPFVLCRCRPSSEEIKQWSESFDSVMGSACEYTLNTRVRACVCCVQYDLVCPYEAMCICVCVCVCVCVLFVFVCVFVFVRVIRVCL